MQIKTISLVASLFVASLSFATPTEPRTEELFVIENAAPAAIGTEAPSTMDAEAKRISKATKKQLKEELKAVKQELKKGKNQKNDINAAADTKGDKSQLVALLLCFFIGGLGIHRFYLGYTWQGVVQLLTAGGCGIWVLIDFIRIIMGTLKPNGGEYAKTL